MTRRARWASLAVLVAVVAASAAIRIHTSFSQPGFDVERPEKMFKSETGLLWYITERIVEAGGLPPPDFRADPRVEHPEASDLPAMFTVGQEFLVAWAALLFGGDRPLHVVATLAMSLVASLVVVGVYGAALELGGRVGWALFAATLVALLPAANRTIGFVFAREDLSLPLFALHLWLALRAVRRGTPGAIALAALFLVGAAATWHAMGFVLAIEAACVFAWFLRSGENPFAARRAWVFAAVVAAGSLGVPVLRAKLFLFSPAVQIIAALMVLAALEPRFRGSGRRRLIAGVLVLAVCAALATGGARVLAGGTSDYAHVLELIVAKVRYLGQLPADPEALSFGARLLWQGPFATSSAQALLPRLGVGAALLAVGIVLGIPGWRRGRGDGPTRVLQAFALASLLAALLIKRTEVLCALLAPLAGIVALDAVRPRAVRAWIVGLLVVQGVAFQGAISSWTTHVWYPLQHQEALAQQVEWIRDHLPGDDPVAAEFVLSTAILAHTDHAIVQQPKYETRRSRDRIEAFFRAFYRGSPADLHHLLAEELGARYLALDVALVWGSRTLGGMSLEDRNPPEGSAASLLMHPDPRVHASVEGFRLLADGGGPRPAWLVFELE